MIRDLCKNISLNKNLLMLVTAGFYILSIYSVLSENQLVIAIAITLLLMLLIIMDYFRPKYILVWALVFYMGVANTSFRLKNVDELISIAPLNCKIFGQIVSIPEKKGDDKLRFFFKVNKIKYDNITQSFEDEKTFVTLNSDKKFRIYDYYELEGRLSPPFKVGNPSQFDYGNYLRNFSVYSVFYGARDSVPLKLNEPPSKIQVCLQRINDYRERIIQKHSMYLKSPNLEILGGIVFGDDAVSPPENIKKSFINSGLLHILAASGMNVAFIFSFFFLILSFLRVNYKVNVSFGIVMVLIYSLMTGLGAPVVRATCMLVFVMLGKLIDRDAHSISLLSFVALLMLIYNPMYINDVGFQLSFAATFGLLIMTPYLMKSDSRIINWIIGTVSIPIIAQIWVIPIQIFYFNNISLYSVFANIMSVPILSIVSFGGFVSSLISTITPDFVCKVFDIILNPLITFLVNISDFWGKLPHSTIQTTHPSVFQLILYYGILLNLIAIIDKNIREKYLNFLKVTIGIMLLLLFLSMLSFPNKNLEITAFDVGNADAFLIKTPDNKYVMIDTGKSGYNGGKSQAEILISKYLLDRGIKKIDTIIVTHFDNDHCGGVVDLINGVKVSNLYVNSKDHESNAAKNIYKSAKENNVNLILAANNQSVFDEDGLKITNYIVPNVNGIGDNEASIVTLVSYKDFKMIFTGDSGVGTFEKLKKFLPPNISVLKVGHHGANGVLSRQMLNYLNPKQAIISVGTNKFGHPSIRTLELLKGIELYRTDINNSIRIDVNDKGYKVLLFNSKRKKFLQVN